MSFAANRRCCAASAIVVAALSLFPLLAVCQQDESTRESSDLRLPLAENLWESQSGSMLQLRDASGGGKFQARIVGGQTAQQGRHPYMAQFWSTLGFRQKFFCDGFLIHPEVVLTAAHCFRSFITAKPEVRIGRFTLTGSEVYVKRNSRHVITHPDHGKAGSNTMDIALVILDRPVDSIEPLNLVGSGDGALPEGTMLTVMGWGTGSEHSVTPTEKLQVVDVPFIPTDKCKQKFSTDRIWPDMICAGWENGKQDACQGDSGGPLIIKSPSKSYDAYKEDVAVGIVSWGVGCARPNTPGVYSNIALIRPWIELTLMENGITLQSGAASESPSLSSAAGCVDVESQTAKCACVDSLKTREGVIVEYQGCGRHLAASGDFDQFCYTNSAKCDSAQSSQSFQGAKWRFCALNEAQPVLCSSLDENEREEEDGGGQVDDPVPDKEADVCMCAADGVSAGEQTEFTKGCHQYYQTLGIQSYWCMVVGGSECADATSSYNQDQGPAFRQCDPIKDRNQIIHSDNQQ